MIKILLDVILLALAIFIVVRAVKRGFVGSVFKLSKILIVLLVTVLLGSMVANLCAEWFVGGWFDGKFSSQFAEKVAQDSGGANVDSLIDSIPVFLRNILPVDSLNEQFASFKGEATELAASLGEKVEQLLTSVVSSIIGYVLTFILAFILFSIVAWILEKFVELPVLKQVNTVLGFLWGIAYSYLFVSIAVCVIGFFVDEAFINSTYVFKFLYNCGLFTHR